MFTIPPVLPKKIRNEPPEQAFYCQLQFWTIPGSCPLSLESMHVSLFIISDIFFIHKLHT